MKFKKKLLFSPPHPMHCWNSEEIAGNSFQHCMLGGMCAKEPKEHISPMTFVYDLAS